MRAVATSIPPTRSSAAARRTNVSTGIPVLARLPEVAAALDRWLDVVGGVVSDEVGAGAVVVVVGDGDGGGPVSDGAALTTNWTGCVAVPSAFVARMLKKLVPTFVGVPESFAAVVSNARPSGSGVVGSMLTAGAGLPPTVNVKLYGVSTTAVGAVPDTVGGTPTVRAFDAADGALSPSALSAVTVKV
jgi:hypothetical protein